MKVLVTGCAGFIGSNLTERLLEDGLKETIGWFEREGREFGDMAFRMCMGCLIRIRGCWDGGFIT